MPDPDSEDFRVKPGSKVSLKKKPTEHPGAFKSKEDAAAATDEHLASLTELQQLLYAQGKHSLLVVLQAMDAGGKDGAIAHVFSGVNPQGCFVASFKAPSTLERSHDFLWRHHLQCPGKGMIAVHNRSHYEAVLVERVKDLVPKQVWKNRYAQINDWESMLAAEGTAIVKFFLHISKAEQKRRFESRLSDPDKHWKFNSADLAERKLWTDYQKAYEELLERCSTEVAPWYIVPADQKWFRNWVISDVLVRTLKGLKMTYPPAEKGLEKLVVE